MKRAVMTLTLTAVTASLAAAQNTTLDRSKIPALGPPPKVSLPPITTRQLPNGLKLMIVEHHELPVVDMILLVGGGGTSDPRGRSGVANLTAAMLTEGTTSRTSLQIADQIAFLGIGLSAGSTWDATRLDLHTPKAQLDSALALFADVALHPSFPAVEFDRVRKNRLTELIQLKDRGPAIANVAYASILYGPNHPYGQSLIGTEASVQAIGVPDLQSYYRANFAPNNATLIVVGDVTPDEITRKIASLFGSWQRGNVQAFNLPTARAGGTRTIYLVDKPGAAQSSFRIGTIGVSRSTRDFFAIAVMNTILGGSFTSRLNQNLRETRGYTYGAGSNFDMRRGPGPFTAQAEIVTAKTDSALLEFMKELNAIRDTVPAAELSKAKRYLQLSLPSSFETTAQIARALVPVALFGLPLDFYNTYVQNIERVTQADVQRVAREYVNPGSLAVVIVGDRKVIEPTLKSLNLGPISIRDMAGQPVGTP